MAQAEQALQRLYEDADLRGDLRDSEAESLLKWAEEQVTRLAEQVTDETQFEAQFDVLRGMLKDMNRLVGRRAEMDADTQAAKLGEITAAAQALGAPVTVQAQTPPDFQAMDDSTALNTLIGMISPTAAQATPAPTESFSAPAPAPAPVQPSPDVPDAPAPAPAPFIRSDAPAPVPAPADSMSIPAPSVENAEGDTTVPLPAPAETENAEADTPDESTLDDSYEGGVTESGEDADPPKNQYPGRTPLYPFPSEETESNDETQF